MKKLPAIVMVLGTMGLAACGETDSTASQNSNSALLGDGGNGSMAPPAEAPEPTGEAYSGNGDITEISGNKVTISHGPIEGIGWPAMTMGFSVNSPDLLRGLSVGDPVNFQFRKAGSDYLITSINKPRVGLTRSSDPAAAHSSREAGHASL